MADKSKDDSDKKKKKSRLSWLWPKIKDIDSAVDAANNAQYLAYIMAFGFGLNIIFLFTTGSSLYGNEAADDLELYLYVTMYVIVVTLLLWLGLRIRKEKFGAIPYICAWAIIESFGKLIFIPGKGIWLIIIVVLLSIGAFRGWLGVRRFS